VTRIPNWLDSLLRGYHLIRDGADVDYPERARTKFAGGGVSVSDDAANGQTVVTITGSAGGGLVTTGVNLTVNTSTHYVVCTVDGITISLPASPPAALEIEVNGPASTTNITINGNGHTINGSGSIVMNQSNQTVALVYSGTEWRIL
jgi:hypothetical protein